MPSRWGVISSIWICAGVALATGCKRDDPWTRANAPARTAGFYCDAFFACNCKAFNNAHQSIEQCRADVEAAWEAALSAGDAAGLQFDPRCLADLERSFDALGCYGAVDLPLLAQLDLGLAATLATLAGCKLYSGTKTAGQPCAPIDEDFIELGDDCERSARCDQGVCRPLTETSLRPAGASCQIGAADCEPGLLCLPIQSPSDARCTLPPAPGETCLGIGDFCRGDAYCDQASKTCRALPSSGQPCAGTPNPLGNLVCSPESFCVESSQQCATRPGPGAACDMATTCAIGSSCAFAEGVCRVNYPVICSAFVDPS